MIRVIEMARTKMHNVLVCTACDEQITKCSMCDKRFTREGEKIECQSDGLIHVCEDCVE